MIYLFSNNICIAKRNVNNLPTSLSEIEQRILKKMKSKNKTDRETSKPIIILNPSNQPKKRIIHSPGSDKADNSFPKLANSSMSSVYSTPYGKRGETGYYFNPGKIKSNKYLGRNKAHIADAMSRIKKSVAQSQSIRNIDLSQNNDSEDYLQNNRDTSSPPIFNQKSKYYSDAKNLQHPQVYRSNPRNKIDLQSLRGNMSKILDESRSNGVNKRYEIATADTETSFGYKFKNTKKSPLDYSQSNISLGPHNGKIYLSLLSLEYSENLRKTPGLGKRSSKLKHIGVNKSISITQEGKLFLNSEYASITDIYLGISVY